MDPEPGPALRIGRYLLHEPIAAGGMASVHLGRMIGPAGFSRTVAIKRLHPHLARDPEFVTMFLDEARLAARVQHPNVAATMDVVAASGEVFLVMEYVQGESLSQLLAAARREETPVPVPVVASIMTGALYGLHAAHEAKSERGDPLAIVHRDVSPQNILVGADGIARVVDFGVAKAASRAQSTQDGKVKGKLAYMAPEQMRRAPVDRRADVYAASVVLWEALAGRKLFTGDDAGGIVAAVLEGGAPLLTDVSPDVSPALAAIVARGLAHEPGERFATAIEMAEAIERASPIASRREVSEWVSVHAKDALEERRGRLTRIERLGTTGEVTASEGPLPPSAAAVRLAAEAPTDKLSPAGAAVDGPVAVDAAPVVTAATPPARPRAWIVVAAALVAAAALALGFLRMRATPNVAAVTIEATAAPSTSGAPAAAEVASAEPAASSEVVAVAAPPPSATATPRAASPRGRVPHAASAKPAKDCDPPFVLNSSGVKRFKAWCL